MDTDVFKRINYLHQHINLQKACPKNLERFDFYPFDIEINKFYPFDIKINKLTN